MDLLELIKTCRTEHRAFDYLFNEIQIIKGIHCPSYNSPDYYLMSKKRLRCKNCRKDYAPFSGTPISGLKISVVSLPDFATFTYLTKIFGINPICQFEFTSGLTVPNYHIF